MYWKCNNLHHTPRQCKKQDDRKINEIKPQTEHCFGKRLTLTSIFRQIKPCIFFQGMKIGTYKLRITAQEMFSRFVRTSVLHQSAVKRTVTRSLVSFTSILQSAPLVSHIYSHRALKVTAGFMCFVFASNTVSMFIRNLRPSNKSGNWSGAISK